MYQDKYIYLIDDVDDDIQLLVFELERVGVGCIEFAKSGREALEYLSKSRRVPDLILVDVEMFPLGGLPLVDKLRDIKKFEDVPMKIMSFYSPEELSIVEFHKYSSDYRNELQSLLAASV